MTVAKTKTTASSRRKATTHPARGSGDKLTSAPKIAQALDIERLLTGLRLPGVDLDQLLAGRKADIRAVASANRIAYDGMNALAKRQTEILRSAVVEWRQAVKDLAAAGRDDRGPLRTKLAREALQRALAEMKNLAETSVQVQSQALKPVLERFRSNLAEMRSLWTRA